MRAKQFMLLCVLLIMSLNTQSETLRKTIISTKNTDIIIHRTIISRHSDIILDRKQISCVAETIYSESRGEPLAGKAAVGITIMNRSLRILHQPPCNVVKQQYTQKRIPAEELQEFHTLAKNIMIGQYRNFIGDRDSFDSFVDKKHKKGSVKIGNHFFYKSLNVA
jgi:hypothetical protein